MYNTNSNIIPRSKQKIHLNVFHQHNSSLHATCKPKQDKCQELIGFKSLHSKVYSLLHKAWYPRVGVSQPMSICQHLVWVKNKYNSFSQIQPVSICQHLIRVGFGLVRFIQPTKCPFLVAINACTKITKLKVQTLHLINAYTSHNFYH